MESFAGPYGRLYDSTRQAIAAAAEAATRPDIEASTVARQKNQQDLLEDTLGRLVDEAHSSNNNGSRRKRPRPAAPSAQAVVEEDAEEGADDKAEGEGLEGQCLGLLAEAFADDLDLLRKDQHFGGSPKSIAAMADMMR